MGLHILLDQQRQKAPNGRCRGEHHGAEAPDSPFDDRLSKRHPVGDIRVHLLDQDDRVIHDDTRQGDNSEHAHHREVEAQEPVTPDRTDDPERDFDSMYADHVLDLYDEDEFENRISTPQEDTEEVIPRDLLMKYLRYAKETVFPKMTLVAKNKVKEYWMELRMNSYGGGGILADKRTLPTIQRLGEANARLNLREDVTEHDIEVAYDLYQYSLRQVGFDDLTGEYDLDAMRGNGISRAKNLRCLVPLSNYLTGLKAPRKWSSTSKRALTFIKQIPNL